MSLLPLMALWSCLDPGEIATRFAAEVARRVEVPAEEQAFYATFARLAPDGGGQYLMMVDRNRRVQVAMLLFRAGTDVVWIGAVPVSTGKPGAFEYFETPLGLFAHTPAHPDFRAEGTRNANGIRGYGAKGMRVFDFGWVRANKGWGDGAMSEMRLQVHATDPDLFEPRLGLPASKGCIRVPAAFNAFLDRYGLLDADYAEGDPRSFVLRRDRRPAAWPGRYLLVVDSCRARRPAWAVAGGR